MEIKTSFIIVALNAASTIGTLLECLKRQTYPHDLIEVILIDSNSEDSTKEQMLRFQQEEKSFWKVKVLDNPKRTLTCGWNVALDSAEGDALLRVDAHVMIPDRFIELNVRDLAAGEKVSRQTTLIGARSLTKRRIPCLVEALLHFAEPGQKDMSIRQHLPYIGEAFLTVSESTMRLSSGPKTMRCTTGCAALDTSFITIRRSNLSGKPELI